MKKVIFAVILALMAFSAVNVAFADGSDPLPACINPKTCPK
jgi:hypothetical protein